MAENYTCTPYFYARSSSVYFNNKLGQEVVRMGLRKARFHFVPSLGGYAFIFSKDRGYPVLANAGAIHISSPYICQTLLGIYGIKDGIELQMIKADSSDDEQLIFTIGGIYGKDSKERT